jgi:hypothetical protein
MVFVEFAVLVGVLALGWNPATIILLYQVAMTTTILLAVLEILFAQAVPPRVDFDLPFSELGRKRGRLQLHERIPPIYPRNVPFAAAVLLFWAVGLLCYLGVLIWGLNVALVGAVSPLVALAALGFVGARLVEFWGDYVKLGKYESVGPHTVKPARQLLVLLLLAVTSVATDPDGGATAALVVIVLLSIGADVLGAVLTGASKLLPNPLSWLAAKLDQFSHVQTREPSPVTPPAAMVPDTEPTARVQVDQRAVLLGVAAVTVLVTTLNRFTVGYLCLLGLAALAGVQPGTLALLAVPLGLYVLTKFASLYFCHGTLEYQRRGEYVVAYDRVLGEPQWATAVGTSREVDLKNRVIDRLLGTRTLEFDDVDAPGAINADDSRGDWQVQLGPVSDLDHTVETLDIPVSDTELPESNHTMLAVGLGLAAFFFVIPLAMLLSPEVSTAMTVGVTVLILPMFALPVGALIWASLSRI